MRTVHALAIASLSISVLATCSQSAAPLPTAPGAAPPGEFNCAAFPDSLSSAYVLPYAVGQRHRVSRTHEHYTPANGGVGLYAIDIPMPIGTHLHAARSGVVVAVEERFADGDRADFHENWVMIRHVDDTVARYIHLTRNGALVEAGERVAQGQVIGLSGDTGASNGPHLHFDVQTCGPNLPPGYNRLPCGMTVPVSFRNTEPHGCGLQNGRGYTALPYEADDR
jgi:murein DD-endopeptidase MepM/ murein hydrolase activator NlpD